MVKEKKDEEKKVVKENNNKEIRAEYKEEGTDKKTGDEEKGTAKNGEKKEVKKDESTKNFLIAVGFILLLAIVFFVTRTITNEPGYETMTYNNFEFTKIGPLWYFQWQQDEQLYTVPLRYNPEEVLDVPITGMFDERFQQENIYLTHDPAEFGLTYIALGASELSLSLATVMGINISAACTANVTEACFDGPIITCDNTNEAVIYIREVPESKIVFVGNCAIIQGQGIELLKAVDKLLYMWYGVIV